MSLAATATRPYPGAVGVLEEVVVEEVVVLEVVVLEVVVLEVLVGVVLDGIVLDGVVLDVVDEAAGTVELDVGDVVIAGSVVPGAVDDVLTVDVVVAGSVVVLDVVVDVVVLDVVVLDVVVLEVVLDVVVVGGGGVRHAAEKMFRRYRAGFGQASRSMLRALLEIDTTSWPWASRHGIRCAWYVFIFGSAPRGATGRDSTVVHGPQGFWATSSSNESPQYPFTAVAATHWPSMIRGWNGNSAQCRCKIGSAPRRSRIHPVDVQYSG